MEVVAETEALCHFLRSLSLNLNVSPWQERVV